VSFTAAPLGGSGKITFRLDEQSQAASLRFFLPLPWKTCWGPKHPRPLRITGGDKKGRLAPPLFRHGLAQKR
jgi:hypothetical protein